MNAKTYSNSLSLMIHNFDSLAKVYPNLAGFLYNHSCIILNRDAKLDHEKDFLSEQKANTMNLLEKRLNRNKVYYRVKSGLMWTDEVGIAARAQGIKYSLHHLW